ncbi:MAG TPA: hypothetical protein VFC57_01555, partial [Aeromicrobium sp.]|nr:hypothetical protein [Aeromicrobium sp.]
FRPKPTQRAGRRKLATLEFEYVQASDLSEHTITHNVWAEVADSGSVETDIQVDWNVMTEVAIQRAQARKRQAMERLMIGDVERAIRRLRGAIEILTDVGPHMAADKRQEVIAEITALRELCDEVRVDRNRSSKMMSASLASMSRGRGRRGA